MACDFGAFDPGNLAQLGEKHDPHGLIMNHGMGAFNQSALRQPYLADNLQSDGSARLSQPA